MNYFFKHFIHEFQLPLKNPVLIFSLILFIILLSPIILKKLNIPGIIGLIISGVIIGPHGFNLLEKNSAIDLFSTIGLLYIMFIAGLELDINEFKANKNKSFLFGFLTFIIPLGIGFPVCHYLLGYDVNASFLTASMFSTHTLVAYPIVSKLGIAKNQAVAITVGATVLTDTAVLIILAIIMGNHAGTLNSDFWIRLLVSLSIFSAIMFLLVPRIAKWFFRELESERHSHYIFVLAVVFFAAFLAEVAGVEPIIGAFVAGLALNKLIPHSSALMNRIEFMGNSLFIPFFLISVGMIVDVSVITHGPAALIVAGTLIAVALSGKWLAAWLTQLFLKYSKAQRQLIFGLSSSHAAATLAIILVGFRANIIDENILNGTIILILVTCVFSSFATEKASKKILLNKEKNEIDILESSVMNSEQILIPTANVETVDKILDLAILIKDKKSANPVTILTVVPNDETAEKNIILSKNKLEEYKQQASATENKVNTVTTIDHNVSSGISRITREILADYILLGWPHKNGILENLISDKFENILTKVNKNIFITHLSKPFVYNKRIVVIIPALAELETGFNAWLKKLIYLSQELSIPVLIFGSNKTYSAIQQFCTHNKINFVPSFKEFSNWEDFLILSRNIVKTDLLFFVSSRKGTMSYNSFLENIPYKLEKYFDENNKIIIYPEQNNAHQENEYDGIPLAPIAKGIESSIEKGIDLIFKKKKDGDR
ncbi:MAG: cation:proton antiporter [Sphingobacteriales bacterium]|uniref:cation:proton antiporter n=1 Tax=Hydrotalea flava TaxID=714549 RepID=UPI00082995FB|nr:cation:proton antiporter [Hydrotalea flava]RTL53410.1 MAG: cation:proton antiporter [Sphingobacteriales bacterium]